MRTQKQFITTQKLIKMKQIIKSFSEGRNYEVGDIVYLRYELLGKDRVPTCKAEVLEPDGEIWRFKLLENQSFYFKKDDIILFSEKPFIFAKETDGGRAKNDTI